MSSNHLQKTPVVDKNGKATHVYKGSAERPVARLTTPPSPTLAVAETVPSEPFTIADAWATETYDDRGFDSKGNHRLTGTPFNQQEEDINGIHLSDDAVRDGVDWSRGNAERVGADGFSKTWDATKGWSFTHHLTGTNEDPDGYSIDGWNSEGFYRGGVSSDGRKPDGSILEFNQSEATSFARDSTDPEVLINIHERNQRGEFDAHPSEVGNPQPDPNPPHNFIQNQATPTELLIRLATDTNHSDTRGLYEHANMTDEAREQIFESASSVEFKPNFGSAMGGFNGLPNGVQNMVRLSNSGSTSRSLKMRVNKKLRELGVKE